MMLADETILYWFGSHRIFGRCLLVVVLVLCSGGVNGADDSVEFFEKKIRPVLVEHCYQCHGAESKELQGELRLDVKAGWQLGGGRESRRLCPASQRRVR